MEPFEFLECSICSEEVIDFAAIFSSNKKFGDKACKHNFCVSCLTYLMEYNTKNKKALCCPICREEFDGFIQNKTSSDLLKQARKLSSAQIFLKNENSKLNEEINSIKNERENEAIQYRERIKQLEDSKSKQVQESTNIKSRIKEMENEIQSLEQARLVNLQNNQTKFDTQQQQILTLTQSFRESQSNYNDSNLRVNELNSQIQKLYKEIEGYRQHIQQQDNHIKKIDNEKLLLQQQLTSIEQSYDRKQSDLLNNTRLKDLQIAKLSDANQQLGTSLSKIQAECEHFKKLYIEIQEDANGGYQKNKNLESAIASLNIELSRSKSVIDSLNSNKRTLEKELEEMKILYQSGRGTSIASSIAPPTIINTANKITNSSYNLINNSIGYFMGTKHYSNDITKPYKSFKIEEKRGNKTSQIHKVSVGNGCGHFVIKLIPTVSGLNAGNSYSKFIYNSIYSNTFTEPEILLFREAMLLYKLNHNNILKLESITKDETSGKFYSVLSPFVPKDLEFILAENSQNFGAFGKISPTTLTFSDIKYIVYQLISVVHYLHTQDLVHRDLKPTSILLFDDYQIKLCSFGNANSVFTNFGNSITQPTYSNPSSYSYLSPEYICSVLDKENPSKLSKEIDWKAFDMWSIGCIFLELIYKKKLFNNLNLDSSSNNNNNNNNNNNINNNNNNNNNIESNFNSVNNQQQQQLYSVLNNISTYKESAPKNGSLYFKENHNIMIKSKVERDFSGANLPTDAYNLLCALLSFNPATRIKANQAAFHKFFKDEPYYIHDSASVSPNKLEDLSSLLTDRNIKQFIKEKCSNLIQV
ncbi:hypothetical protein ACTFIZ_009458 [Dictyostelium cf. discoideum]